MYGTTFSTFTKRCSHVWFLLGFKVILIKICRHCPIRFYFKRHWFCRFVSQKLHFNIKTQKQYCNNHNRAVFFTITRKILLSINFFALINNYSSACCHEYIL